MRTEILVTIASQTNAEPAKRGLCGGGLAGGLRSVDAGTALLTSSTYFPFAVSDDTIPRNSSLTIKAARTSINDSLSNSLYDFTPICSETLVSNCSESDNSSSDTSPSKDLTTDQLPLPFENPKQSSLGAQRGEKGREVCGYLRPSYRFIQFAIAILLPGSPYLIKNHSHEEKERKKPQNIAINGRRRHWMYNPQLGPQLIYNWVLLKASKITATPTSSNTRSIEFIGKPLNHNVPGTIASRTRKLQAEIVVVAAAINASPKEHPFLPPIRIPYPPRNQRHFPPTWAKRRKNQEIPRKIAAAFRRTPRLHHLPMRNLTSTTKQEGKREATQ
nr:hypothetical protein Iba_chr12fCG4100 [Ipomoea batatas]